MTTYTVEVRTRRTAGPVLSTSAVERYTVVGLDALYQLTDRLELAHAAEIAAERVEVCVS